MTPAGAGRALLVGTLTRWPYDLRELPAGVTHLEVRADLIGDIDPRRLRADFPGTLLYTLRSRRHGGGAADPPPRRRQRLTRAADHYDLVDLEANGDLDPRLLAVLPPRRRRISWHGPALPLADLNARFAAMAAVPAAGYLIAVAAAAARDALAPLRLLHQLGRRDVTAYGTGPAGTWSRLLAPWLGAPAVTGRLTTVDAGGPGDDGTPAVTRLCADYGLPDMPALRELYGIAGSVARNTGFPRLHNLGYRRRGLPNLFLPFYLPTVDDFRTGFWPEVPDGLRELGLPLRGLTISGPLKEAALRVADEIGPAALACGSANIMVARRRRWLAETTDATAVAAVLRRAGVALAARPAAVIGCGGAGRAAAVALAAAGARVTVVNRTESRGLAAAELLGLPYAPLASFVPAGPAVVVHATSSPAGPPIRLDGLTGEAVIVDLVCAPEETALVAAARRRGLRAIDGWAVLGAEAEQQFRMMTGSTMPSEAGQPGRPARGAGHATHAGCR